MCQFCTEHGEGKKWYLQMKNYSDVLLHEELSSSQKDVVEATTRLEALVRGFENSVMPAISGVSKAQTESPDAPPPTEESSKVQPSEDEIVARRKIGYFGQVLPIEDVEKVIVWWTRSRDILVAAGSPRQGRRISDIALAWG